VADEVERRGLAERLFALVKPVCLFVAKKSRGAPGGSLSAELRGALLQRLSADKLQRAASFGERVEHFLAMRSRRLLCLSVVRAVARARDREAAVEELTTFGVRQLKMILNDTLEDLFAMQVYTAAALALVAAAVPSVVYAVAR
jgi:hypothetical protein